MLFDVLVLEGFFLKRKVLVDKMHREINFLYISENPYFVCIPLSSYVSCQFMRFLINATFWCKTA